MRTRQLVRDLIRKTPNPERRYINDRGTLITLAVKAHHDGLRDERVKRAETNANMFARRIQYHGNPQRAYRPANAARWQNEDRSLLAFYQVELKTAKRIVADRNGRGEVCVVHVSPVKMPRVWPNALPGGTSARRANNNVWRMNKEDNDNDSRAPY